MSETRVQLRRALGQLSRSGVGLLRAPPPKLPGLQVAIVSFQIVGARAGDALQENTRIEIEGQRGDDLGRHIVLNCEDVGQFPVEPLGPEVAAGRRVCKLGSDPDPSTGFSHASFDDVAPPRLFPTSATSTFLPLKVNDELRAMTNSCESFDNAVMMSSVTPSAKYSCSASPLMLANGSTAIDTRDAFAGAGAESMNNALCEPPPTACPWSPACRSRATRPFRTRGPYDGVSAASSNGCFTTSPSSTFTVDCSNRLPVSATLMVAHPTRPSRPAAPQGCSSKRTSTHRARR